MTDLLYATGVVIVGMVLTVIYALAVFFISLSLVPYLIWS